MQIIRKSFNSYARAKFFSFYKKKSFNISPSTTGQQKDNIFSLV